MPGGEGAAAPRARPVDLAHLARQTLGDRALEQEVLKLFLHQAARSSWELMRVRARLEPLRVEDVMTRAPLVADLIVPLAEAGTALGAEQVVRPRDTAWQAFLKLGKSRGGRVAVVDGHALVGVVSDRDLQNAQRQAKELANEQKDVAAEHPIALRPTPARRRRAAAV